MTNRKAEAVQNPPTELEQQVEQVERGDAIFQEEIGARLRQLRDSCGWTVEQVAKQTGISANLIIRYEHGRRQISAAHLVLFAKLYGASPDRLVTGAIGIAETKRKWPNNKDLLSVLADQRLSDEDKKTALRFLASLLIGRRQRCEPGGVPRLKKDARPGR